MNTYITHKQIVELKNGIQNDLDDYTRKGRKIVYNVTGEWRVILLYALDILERIRRMIMKNGKYHVSSIVQALRSQDWYRYSLGGKSLSSEKARERIGLKKSMPMLDVLYEQGAILQKAGFYVITLLEEV